MPEVSDPTVRKELPKVEPVTGVKSYQGSRIGRCGWITSFLRKVVGVGLLMICQGEKLNILVAMRLWDTPVLIPNTKVKT